ncbi:hypothetical protein ACFU93_33580 [Streptomyces sp. NPDC057611]|uniref:hypothetical protein n=1 Tax=Streptomyces sp. NPDC057611 TaxID=3346182 RepID=UPI00368BB54F
MGDRDQGPRDAGALGALPQLRLDEPLEGLHQQVTQERAPRDRIHTLPDAVLAIGSELELEVVLQRIVEPAASLVDAKYGALGVPGEEGTIKQFLTVGVDEETSARIGHYRCGEGILGLLIRHPEPLRLADLATVSLSLQGRGSARGPEKPRTCAGVSFPSRDGAPGRDQGGLRRGRRAVCVDVR